MVLLYFRLLFVDVNDVLEWGCTDVWREFTGIQVNGCVTLLWLKLRCWYVFRSLLLENPQH